MALFRDRTDAGRELAAALRPHVGEGDAVVVGLARGGVVVAAAVARILALPLDAVAVRKIGYPWQPEYGIGAVTPGGGGVYVRTQEDLSDEQLAAAVGKASAEAEALDAVLHERRAAAGLEGRTAILVDDGLATGATMVAAARWARARGAGRVVVAVPVGSSQGVEMLRAEADEVVCPFAEPRFGAVGFWYDAFGQVATGDVVALLDALHEPAAAAP